MKNLKSEVLPERFKVAREQINTIYKIPDLATTFGIKMGATGQQVCCPFHGDRTPSFSVDMERNIFKCFGCGVGGSFVEFYKCCENKYNDRKLSIPTVVDEILSKDIELQAVLGFSTVKDTYESTYTLFKEDNTVDTELLQREKPVIVDTICLKHVMDKVSRMSTAKKVEFIGDCEQGRSHAYLIQKYYYEKSEYQEQIVETSTEDMTELFTSIFNEE